MFGSNNDLAEDHAELRTKYAALRQQYADKTAECETWRAQARAGQRHADDLITRSRQLSDTQTLLRATEDDLATTRRRIAAITVGRLAAWQDAGRRARQQAGRAKEEVTA